MLTEDREGSPDRVAKHRSLNTRIPSGPAACRVDFQAERIILLNGEVELLNLYPGGGP